ncbi:hypothetical protein ATANTOWER_027225 [Ataeniobius toweri]|uniref:Uncharacterized protein n=1 Tax=Ataeniobius toweri TaxID=208326 RepID=A0ABU7A0I0_9TELE|nr:hypothetical protein [Ataeniobius toweri]
MGRTESTDESLHSLQEFMKTQRRGHDLCWDLSTDAVPTRAPLKPVLSFLNRCHATCTPSQVFFDFSLKPMPLSGYFSFVSFIMKIYQPF